MKPLLSFASALKRTGARHLIVGLFFFLVFNDCLHAQSQVELNAERSRELSAAEQSMAVTLNSIKQLYPSDARFLRCLTESQQAWENYRDRQLAMIFPHEDESQNLYGSVFPMCWYIWKTKITQQRIAELKPWIDGIKEGDVCRGSIRVK